MTDTPQPQRCTVEQSGRYDEIIIPGVIEEAVAIDHGVDAADTPSVILAVSTDTEPVVASKSSDSITYRIDLPTEAP